MTKLWIDTETYSTVPIKHGVHKYAEAVEVMLFAWALDDGPVSVLDLTRASMLPRELNLALIDDSVEVWAHNSHFDRTVLRHHLPRCHSGMRVWPGNKCCAMTMRREPVPSGGGSMLA